MKRTDRFNNKLSEEGPRKETSDAGDGTKVVSLLLTCVTACPTQWQPFLLTFVGLDKSKAAGGPRPAGFDVYQKSSKGPNLNFAGPGRQPGYFLY
jgi:hypothetical protein